LNASAVSIALNIVVASLAQRGGSMVSVPSRKKEKLPDLKTPSLSPKDDECHERRCWELIGLGLSDDEIISSLHKMRYGALARAVIMKCSPAYRSDILHTCDLLEDIAIAYGFDRITPELPQTSTTGRSHPFQNSGFDQ